MTINFPLASNFPFKFRKFDFHCPPRKLDGGRYGYPSLSPKDSYLNLEYDYMKNMLRKIISRAIC